LLDCWKENEDVYLFIKRIVKERNSNQGKKMVREKNLRGLEKKIKKKEKKKMILDEVLF
jgi:hypothetical protein